ncbi:competence protein CoiA family protein [Kineococcus sp. SYSU DK006]|uniref:competence protein CoiA family protein n=1 Tax=Kineococcus sp. SYSU DK006 TaxID=3383127 RepID=UPI003D7E2E2F
MPECSDPRLTTVARHPRRRDGFSHHAGSGGHSAEGEAHQQAKAALRAWVHDTLGDQGVTAVAEQASADRTRVADVMVTWPNGRQVALEVQYAALSVEQWRTRHASYQEQGITAVWLLGHQGKHLRRARAHSWEPDGAADGLIALSDLHAAMTQAGVPMLWINPVWGEGAGIGTASTSTSPHRVRDGSYGDEHGDSFATDTRFHVPPDPHQERAAFHADPLTTCTLTPDGLSTPTLQRLHHSERLLTSVNAARQAIDRARAAAEAEARRAREARAQVRADELARWVQQQREHQQQAWDTSALKQRVLARYDGTIPFLLSVRLGGEGGLYAPPEHWRAAIYAAFIWRKAGCWFTIADAYRCIAAEGIEHNRKAPRFRALALLGWLQHLQLHRYVQLHHDPADPRRILRVTVLGDLDNPPPPTPSNPPARNAAPPAPPAPRGAARPPARPPARAAGQPDTSPLSHTTQHLEQPRKQNHEQQPEQPLHHTGAAAHSPQPTSSAATQATATTQATAATAASEQSRPRCRRCQRPLDPLLATYGLHILCLP